MTISRIHGAVVAAAVLLVASACSGGGGGGGGSSSPPAPPAYVNGTTTGQYTNNDIGFYLGAATDPATVTTTSPSPKLRFDIGNGYMTASTVKWRVKQNGLPFSSGEHAGIPALSAVDIEVAIPSAAGSYVYRIELDYGGEFSETNENNNFVELTVTVPASG